MLPEIVENPLPLSLRGHLLKSTSSDKKVAAVHFRQTLLSTAFKGVGC